MTTKTTLDKIDSLKESLIEFENNKTEETHKKSMKILKTIWNEISGLNPRPFSSFKDSSKDSSRVDEAVLKITVIRTSEKNLKCETIQEDVQQASITKSPYFRRYILNDKITYTARELWKKEEEYEMKVDFCEIEDFPDVILILRSIDYNEDYNDLVNRIKVKLLLLEREKKKDMDMVKFYNPDPTNYIPREQVQKIIKDLLGSNVVSVSYIC